MQSLNKLYYGDNLEVLRKYIKDETVDLCYIDPPFNSKRNYNQIYNNIGREDKAQAQAFIDTWRWDDEAEKGFTEIIENYKGVFTGNYNGVFTKQSINLIIGLEKVLGKGSLLAYLVSMTLRIAEIYRVLKPTGSFYFHCDPTSSHYLKLIIDAIFVPNGGDFKNEIVWCYKSRPISKKHFCKKHDIIFFYSRSDKYYFDCNANLQPLSPVTIKKYIHEDKKGKYRLVGRGITGSPIRSAKDVDPEWEVTHPELVKRDYLRKGYPIEDWWYIDIINQSSQERLGYPTQKPEALLERIIKASSKEGDLILDAYCGCGTTIAVAERLKRRWIGIDITYQSISLILKRLEEHFGEELIRNISLNGIPRDMESAIALANKKDDRLRKEFEKWSVLTFSNNKAIINEKKGGDKGIDGISFIVDSDDSNEQIFREVLFSVKSSETLSPSVIRDLNGTIERENAAMGYLITLYPMKNLVHESKKYGAYNNKQFGYSYPKIDVINVEEILAGKRMELPISLDVLKKAERKYIVNQTSLSFE